MQLVIKLNQGMTLKDAAQEIQGLNVAMGPLLENGPISCNPDSETVEGYLGDANTPPNQFGYVAVALGNYRKLILPPGLAPSTFSIVLGEPVEEVDGVEVRGGTLV